MQGGCCGRYSAAFSTLLMNRNNKGSREKIVRSDREGIVGKAQGAIKSGNTRARNRPTPTIDPQGDFLA